MSKMRTATAAERPDMPKHTLAITMTIPASTGQHNTSLPSYFSILPLQFNRSHATLMSYSSCMFLSSHCYIPFAVHAGY